MIPCKDCITLAICTGYLSERNAEYPNDISDVSYNCTSLYRLQRKCTLLSSYFPCDYSTVMRPSWYEDCGINSDEWFKRYNEVIKFYQKFWVIGMREVEGVREKIYG